MNTVSFDILLEHLFGGEFLLIAIFVVASELPHKRVSHESRDTGDSPHISSFFGNDIHANPLSCKSMDKYAGVCIQRFDDILWEKQSRAAY